MFHAFLPSGACLGWRKYNKEKGKMRICLWYLLKNLLDPPSSSLPVAGEAGQVSCCCIAAVRLEPAAIWGDSRCTNPHTHTFIPHILTACSEPARLGAECGQEPLRLYGIWAAPCESKEERTHVQAIDWWEPVCRELLGRPLQVKRTRKAESSKWMGACCHFEGKEMGQWIREAEEDLSGEVKLSRVLWPCHGVSISF